MSRRYNLAIKAFIDEMTKEEILPEKIKHLGEKRIKEIALNGLKTASNGELSHLFHCPKCMMKWNEFKFASNYSPQKSEHKHSAYAAK